jgi:DNA-binding LacI/PurR family transcriptional regulator
MVREVCLPGMADGASLADVARLAGVATSTVSLALRGDGRVKPATRDRVLTAAAQLGYEPRPEISALAAKRFVRPPLRKLPSLGFLTPRRQRWTERQLPLFREAAARHGFDTVHFHREEGESVAALQQRVLAGGCLGLAICHLQPDDVPVHFARPTLPIVLVSLNRPDLPLPSIYGDPFQECLRAWQEALRRGWRRIGACLLIHPEVILDDLERLAATRLAQERWLARGERIPIFSYYRMHGRDGELLAWARRHRPEALISFNGSLPGLLAAAGMALPNIALNMGSGSPRQTGILNPVAEVMRAGAEHLIEAIRYRGRKPETGHRCVRIQAAWHEGETLPWKP